MTRRDSQNRNGMEEKKLDKPKNPSVYLQGFNCMPLIWSTFLGGFLLQEYAAHGTVKVALGAA